MTTKPRNPRRMWADHTHLAPGTTAYLLPEKGRPSDIPVLVIDLSPASVEAMVEKCANALYFHFGGIVADWTKTGPVTRDAFFSKARAALASLGITAGKRGRK